MFVLPLIRATRRSGLAGFGHVLGLLGLLASSACASLLDFQEPTDLVTDASSTEEPAAADAGSTQASPERDAAKAESESDRATAEGEASPDENVGLLIGPPSCSACSPAVPAGWYGPLAIHEGSGTTAPPSCSGDYPVTMYDGFAGPQASPAVCSCSCSAPSGATCSKPKVSFYSNSSCSADCGAGAPQLQLPTCGRPSTLTCDAKEIHSFSVSPSVPSGGACSPVATEQLPRTAWATAVRLCGRSAPGETCEGGGTCSGSTFPPFAATNRCMLKTGSWACPSGFPVRRSFYTGGTDTRACSSCSCGSPNGVACSASVSTYDASSCGGAAITRSAPTSCAAVPSVQRLTVTEPAPYGGSCAASGGAPIGDFVPDGPSTVCCTE